MRFPVWSKNKYKNKEFKYDILLYVANWPAARSDAWKALLKARAIENASYVIGLNRIGNTTVMGIFFISVVAKINFTCAGGSSRVFNFQGKRLDKFTDNNFHIEKSIFIKTELNTYREKSPVLQDADDFNLL